MPFRCILPTLTVGLTLASHALFAQPALQPDDLMTLTTVGDVSVAPGGMRAAVSVTVPNPASDTRSTALHVITRKGETAGTQVLEGARLASWSADGTTLRFVASVNGAAVLRALDAGSGATRTLVELPGEPRYLVWSKDESHVAVVADVPAPAQSWFRLPASPAAAQKPVIIDHANIRSGDGAWLPATTPHLYVVGVSTGSSREIPFPEGASLDETETGDGGPPSWTPDGRSLVISVARGWDARFNLWNVNRDLLQINLESGAYTWVSGQPGVERNPAVSPDGRLVAFQRQRGDATAVVYHSDLVVRDLVTGRERVPLGGRDVDVEGFAWMPDGRALLTSYLERGKPTLLTVTLQGRTRLITDEGLFRPGVAQVSRDGLIAFARSEQNAPPEAYFQDRSGRIVQLTNLNGVLRSRRLSIVRDIDYLSAHADRRPIHALVASPAGMSDTSALPVVVDLHGGPFSASTFGFDADRELFVSQGYVVVQPNFRGSWGYGSAFAQLSDRKHYPGWYDQPDAPGEMGLDVAGVLDAVREQRLGDPKRVFLRGISAGALITSWTLGRTTGFRAAVAQSWYPGEWSAPSYGWFQIRRYFNGPPWDPAHQPAYWRRQPIMLADRMTTPLLVMQGEKDWITPEMEAEKFYYALRSLGRDVKLVVFPDEIHGLEKHPASVRNSRLMEVCWFRAHDSGASDQKIGNDAC